MDAIQRERDQLERDLHRALRSGEIKARFTPSFHLQNGEVAGFEIIPAWARGSGSEVAPERFVPLAEATGHIHQLAASVLSGACRAVAG